MATLGNGMDFGNLTTAGTQMSATSGTTRGIIHNTKGDNSTNTESIEQIQIATTGNATDFGNLNGTFGYMGAACDAHGGL